jgi:hypothetical protein
MLDVALPFEKKNIPPLYQCMPLLLHYLVCDTSGDIALLLPPPIFGECACLNASRLEWCVLRMRVSMGEKCVHIECGEMQCFL